MAKEAGAIHEADKSALIDSKDLKDVSPERKAEFLKRIAKEDKAAKKLNVKVEEWIEVTGNKVLHMAKTAVGSVHSRYFFGIKRNQAEYERLKKNGGYEFVGEVKDQKSGKMVEKKSFVPLKYVNGRPFKKAE